MKRSITVRRGSFELGVLNFKFPVSSLGVSSYALRVLNEKDTYMRPAGLSSANSEPQTLELDTRNSNLIFRNGRCRDDTACHPN